MKNFKRLLALAAALTLLLAALPAVSVAEHAPVNFYMTDVDITDAVAVDEGGTGFGADKFIYLGVSAGSGMYSCQYLIDYPEQFVTVTAQSKSWAGGLIAQTQATMDDDEQWSDQFDSVCNIAYEGQTGGKPVGEAGNIYVNGGCYLTTTDFLGVQAGGLFHRFTVRLDSAPSAAQCMHDAGGYYLPVGLQMLEFTYGRLDCPGYEGILHGSENCCKPQYADWFSSTDGKIYVTPSGGAPDEVTVTAGTVNDVIPGDTVTVPIMIGGGDYEANTLTMCVYYNTGFLELQSVSNGSFWSTLPNDALTLVDYTTYPGVIMFSIACPTDGFTGHGAIFNAQFRVKENCAADQVIDVDVDLFDYFPVGGTAQGVYYVINNGSINLKRITVTFTGEYNGVQLVPYGGNAELPVLDSAAYRYVFTVDGQPWDGTDLTEDVTVTVGIERIILLGDVNGDGDVTFADISALYNYLIGGNDQEVSLEVGDINGDGELTFADISALYNMIIGG